MTLRFYGQISLFLGLLLIAAPAKASNPGDACTSAQNGQVQMEAGVLMICDGTTWNGAMQITSSSGKVLFQVDTDGGSCTSTKLGRIRYSSSASPAWTYCNGSAWTPFDQASGNWGYFVQTTTKWNGNLGGLSGANAKCLTELQTTYSWTGKSGAGTLSASRVFAFLCDGTSCNNLQPNTFYRRAKANSTAVCDGFLTDANGRGPGAQMYWDENCFISSTDNWTNRLSFSSSQWDTSPAAKHCTNWTNGSSGQGISGNSGYAYQERWNQSADSCGTANFLICFVNPQ